jgi:hypothetical protein
MRQEEIRAQQDRGHVWTAAVVQLGGAYGAKDTMHRGWTKVPLLTDSTDQ